MPGDSLSPEYRRKLIRLANREHVNAEDMLDLLMLAEVNGLSEHETIQQWKASWDVEG